MIAVLAYVVLVVTVADPMCSVWLRFPWGHTGACAAVSVPCVPADAGRVHGPHTGAQGSQTNEQQETRR